MLTAWISHSATKIEIKKSWVKQYMQEKYIFNAYFKCYKIV